MANLFATVGLKNVSTGDPTIWVNDIPGISSELATALRTSDAPAALAVWEKVQRLGLEKLTSLIENDLSKSADFVYSRSQSGQLTGKPDLMMSRPNSYLGWQIVATVRDNEELFIDTLSLEAGINEAVDRVVKVYDARGRELFSKTVTIQPDYNEIAIGYATRSRFGFDALLFVGIDGNGLALSILGDGQEWSDNTVGLTPAYMAIDGGHAWAQVISDSSAGVKIKASIRRSLSDVIARYADRLGWAYAYVCASLLLSEKLASPNFNLYTNTNRAFTEEQIPVLMDEAVTRIRPIARDMLKELNRVEAVTPKADRPFDAGYSVDSYC